MEMQAPYVHTTLLVNEFINLTYENSNGLIKVREHSGMRKDRTSSCGYGYYVILELSKNLKPRSASDDILSKFVIRKPHY